MAKAKVKAELVKAAQADKAIAKVATTAKETNSKFVFVSRDKSITRELDTPMEKNVASKVLFDVLSMGPVPKGLKLQWAESYNAHFINRKGKNALGASKAQNLLVVNGIADELKAAGVKGIVQPTKKPYFAIKLGGKTPEEIKEITMKAATILGFTGSKKVETGNTATAKA